MRALARIEEAHEPDVGLAPAGTPGGERGPTYGELLGLVRGLGLGETRKMPLPAHTDETSPRPTRAPWVRLKGAA